MALEKLSEDSDSTVHQLQVLRISCRTGFQMKDENDTYQFSKKISCSRTGQWNIDPETVKCIRECLHNIFIGQNFPSISSHQLSQALSHREMLQYKSYVYGSLDI